MITTNNAANSSKYDALFKDAFDFLIQHALEDDEFPSTLEDREIRKSLLQELVDDGRTQFTSVQEYFSHIQDLLILGGKKYLMLPLDEPVFEIDANKREIVVPAEFKKNGISVQGDEIAESLIFRINRFFDYADLREMVPQVQWENANKEEGTSSIFVVDDSRSADYLYLMWPLKEEITKYPGTVKFSLRFYNAVGNDLVYSFSTKIAAATINASHDFSYEKLSTNVVDAESNFAAAIKNSKNTALEDAAMPFFFMDLDQSADITDENAIAQRSYQAFIDEDNPEQLLRVEASSMDTGLISYTWFYRDDRDTSVDGGKHYNLIPSTNVSEIYLASADTVNPTPGKKYYRQEGSDFIPSDFIAGQMYEKYSVVKVTSPHEVKAVGSNDVATINDVVGEYWVEVKNTVGGNYSNTESKHIYFPAPEVLAIDEDLPDYAFMDAEDKADLVVTAIIDEYGAKDSYDWYYSPTGFGDWEAVGSLSDAAADAKLEVEGNTLHVNGLKGFYKVDVRSTRNYCDYWIKNGAWAPALIPSNECKLSPALAAPVITYPTEDMALTSLYGPVSLHVEVEAVDDPFRSERMTYQWYTVDGDLRTEIAGATEAELVVPQDTKDAYICEVTNHVGDQIRIADSETFSVWRFPNVPDGGDQGDEPGEDEPTPVDTHVPAAVSKIAAASMPADENQALAQENQENVTILQDGNSIVIQINDELNEFLSTNPYQQDRDHAWVAIDIDTGFDSIIGMTWDGDALTQSDVDDANSLGLGAGHIVFWAKADVIATAPRTITLGATGYDPRVLTVTVDDRTQG